MTLKSKVLQSILSVINKKGNSKMTSNQKRFIEKIAEVLDYELPLNYEKWTNKQASDFISENIDDFNYYMKR